MTATENAEIEHDDWDDEPEYGQPYAEGNPMVWIKGYVQGQESLDEVAEVLAGVAAYLKDAAAQGWVLTQPTDNGYVWIHWGGEGPPPARIEGD